MRLSDGLTAVIVAGFGLVLLGWLMMSPGAEAMQIAAVFSPGSDIEEVFSVAGDLGIPIVRYGIVDWIVVFDLTNNPEARSQLHEITWFLLNPEAIGACFTEA